jgi:hypothetical protein
LPLDCDAFALFGIDLQAEKYQTFNERFSLVCTRLACLLFHGDGLWGALENPGKYGTHSTPANSTTDAGADTNTGERAVVTDQPTIRQLASRADSSRNKGGQLMGAAWTGAMISVLLFVAGLATAAYGYHRAHDVLGASVAVQVPSGHPS